MKVQCDKCLTTLKQTIKNLTDRTLSSFNYIKCVTPKGCKANLLYQFEFQGYQSCLLVKKNDGY